MSPNQKGTCTYGVLMVSWARALVAKTAAAAREAKKDFMVVEGRVDDGGRTRRERVGNVEEDYGWKKEDNDQIISQLPCLFTRKQAITKACPMTS